LLLDPPDLPVVEDEPLLPDLLPELPDFVLELPVVLVFDPPLDVTLVLPLL
jgi:hypothetical protein